MVWYGSQVEGCGADTAVGDARMQCNAAVRGQALVYASNA